MSTDRVSPDNDLLRHTAFNFRPLENPILTQHQHFALTTQTKNGACLWVFRGEMHPVPPVQIQSPPIVGVDRV